MAQIRFVCADDCGASGQSTEANCRNANKLHLILQKKTGFSGRSFWAETFDPFCMVQKTVRVCCQSAVQEI